MISSFRRLFCWLLIARCLSTPSWFYQYLPKSPSFGWILSRSIITARDRSWMKRALTLARHGLRRTFPNPCVGCVITLNDTIVVGEGWHERAGQSHAEVMALEDMKRRNPRWSEIKGQLTAYVTLEPCNHYGRTPPCTMALMRHNISRVVVGMVDPDERVATEGIKRLQRAGIEVELIGEEEEAEAVAINRLYIHRTVYNQTYNVALILSSEKDSCRRISEAEIKEMLSEVKLLDTLVLLFPMSKLQDCSAAQLEILSRFVDLFPNLVVIWDHSSSTSSIQLVRNLEEFLSNQLLFQDVRKLANVVGRKTLMASTLVPLTIKSLSKLIKDELKSNGILFVDVSNISLISNEDDIQVVIKQCNDTFQIIK